MSEKLMQRYKTKKKVLEKLIEVIDMIENGSSESDACKNVGINKHSFRHFLNADFSFESSFNPCYNDEKEPEEYPTWQDELFSDIMGYEKKQSYYCEGFEQIIEDCLNKLSEKEQTIIRYRYMEGYTLSEIGKRLSLSRERVRQILNKTLRRLRHPVYCKNLCYGYSIQDHSFITNEEIENKRKELYELNEKKLLELNAIKKDIEKIKDSNKHKSYTDLFNAFCKEKGFESLEEINNLFDNIPIENLGLSVRAYNSLRRVGCNTLADLIEIIYSENLRNVRNLGFKSIKEILKIAIDYGADKDKIMSLYLI